MASVGLRFGHCILTSSFSMMNSASTSSTLCSIFLASVLTSYISTPILMLLWLLFHWPASPELLQMSWAPVGPGYPFSSLFLPCPFISSSFAFLLFTLFLFLVALSIFFFCPSLPQVPFLQESFHSVSRPEVVGGDRTWV